MKLIVFSLLMGAAIGDFAYKPSGWRPTGPPFVPHDNRLRFNGYDNKPATLYDVPDVYPSISSAADVDRITTTTTTTTSTPRNREFTTQFNIDNDDDDDDHHHHHHHHDNDNDDYDEDTQNNPALAIANSFAFNKPVFIYNGVFPFNPGFTFVK